MNRSRVIEKYYKDICNICASLTRDWEDLAHDLCEYFLTCKADIVEIESRGKFKSYVCGAALRRVKLYKINDNLYEIDLPEIDFETLDTSEIIKRLDEKDLKILTIFAGGESLNKVSEKVFICSKTLSKHLKKAQKNAKRIINDL